MAYYYQYEVKHSGLNKYRVVKGRTKTEALQKANALQRQWEEQWIKKQQQDKVRVERNNIQMQRELTKLEHEKNTAIALVMTKEAEEKQMQLDSVLLRTLSEPLITFDILKDKSRFKEKKPMQKTLRSYMRIPERADIEYNPQLSFLDRMSSKKKDRIKNENDKLFNNDFEESSEFNKKIELENQVLMDEYKVEVNDWEDKKKKFYLLQEKHNSYIEEKLLEYEEGDADSVQWLYENLLNTIQDPCDFERQIEIEFLKDTKMLIVNQFFPTVADLPNIKKVIYIKTKSEFNEAYLNDAYLNKKYDNFIYNLTLQTLYIIFENDKLYDKVDSVVLNGKVNTIDLTTGAQIEPYILTISVKKTDIALLNLELIDPRAWFKSSKGIAASKIATITPVAPILEMSKDDSRFIDGYSVMPNLEESTNLASIDWQDFENLIREIFEKEFNANGGEVKITQASRDGGVDAVVFDPDPIRGGKIIIQAKRYTNVVGVSAVRDLYGTIMNEGAMKGILVTTANYGNDAYNFAQGKPITLLNGANLLAMLERHGHTARIDIKEARQLMNNTI